MTTDRMSAERRAEIKKIAARVPFIDNGVGVPETQQAFADLLRELAAVEAERDEARKTLLAGPDKIVRCAFCGHEYPEGTPVAKHEALRQHVRRCKVHPLYIEFMDYLRAECEAWGVDATLPDDAPNPPFHLAVRIALKQSEMRKRLSILVGHVRAARAALSADAGEGGDSTMT